MPAIGPLVGGGIPPSHSTIQPQKETYEHPTPASTQILVLLVQEAESVTKLERRVSPREKGKKNEQEPHRMIIEKKEPKRITEKKSREFK